MKDKVVHRRLDRRDQQRQRFLSVSELRSDLAPRMHATRARRSILLYVAVVVVAIVSIIRYILLSS